MARARRAAALWIVAGLLSGCGTMANLSMGAREGWKNAQIYGGVRRDIQSIEKWTDHSWTWGKNLDIMQDVGTAVGDALIGIDVPLSAIGDTLTLPVTIPASIWGSSGNGTTVRRKTTDNPPAAPTSK